MITYILLDIEGTTTSINFVHETLFPYAYENIEQFVRQNSTNPEIACIISELKNELKSESLEEIIEQLKSWISEDKKQTQLKAIQGYIWREGFEKGCYVSHLYEDVLPMLKLWKGLGLELGIYSSGSVNAQKLLFSHTQQGDITSLISHYFDTKVGHKREQQSYHNIVTSLGLISSQVLFLSDVPEELDAAKAIGLKTIQLVRPGTQAGNRHVTVTSFNEIDLANLDK